MKLAEFLAKRLADEGVLIDDSAATPESGEIEFVIQQGIEAFVRTEHKQVAVRDIATDHLDELSSPAMNKRKRCSE